jgi:hypothetical protein
MPLLRKLLTLSCALFTILANSFGQAFTSPEITISSNTLVAIAGPVSPIGAAAWVTNTAYAQGAVVRGTGLGLYYFAVTAGTSTNNPALGPSGMGRVTDGTVVWRPCLNSRRTWLSVQDTSTNSSGVVFISDYVGGGTNLARVVALQGGGSVVIDTPGTVPQGTVYAISSRNTAIVVCER